MYADAEVGIGFLAGSLSTLRPLFSSRARQSMALQRQQATSGYSLPAMGRAQRVVGTDVKRLSQTYRESDEEELVEDTLSIGKAL